MTDDRRALEEVVRTRLLRVNATVQGVVTGIVAAGTLFIATNWLLLKGGPVVGPHLALLGQFFPGYRVTFLGSVIGAGYAFVLGFVGGWATVRMYNWFADLRQGRS